MKVPDACKILCKKNHNKADMRMFRSIIDDEYRIDWLVDNLPGAMRNDEYVFCGWVLCSCSLACVYSQELEPTLLRVPPFGALAARKLCACVSRLVVCSVLLRNLSAA
jgi:hypothetical protein